MTSTARPARPARPTRPTRPTRPARPARPAPPGRPRDQRIDDAVLVATIELLEEVGYLQLTIAAVADRAGSSKPAIYRRWPTKALLVQDAAFPAQGPEMVIGGADLRDDIGTLVAIGVEMLGRPAARAALPGLLAEMTGDSALRAHVVGRFACGAWGALEERIREGIDSGQVRADVDPSTVLEMIAGTTLLATVLRPLDEIGGAWVHDVVELVMHGISP